jgi:hypothetical protein
MPLTPTPTQQVHMYFAVLRKPKMRPYLSIGHGGSAGFAQTGPSYLLSVSLSGFQQDIYVVSLLFSQSLHFVHVALYILLRQPKKLFITLTI